MKVTEDVLERMKTMRKRGATYDQIMKDVGVSKWSCITYLKDIEVDMSWVEKEWRKAEKEAQTILSTYGFSHILNLNEICPSPYWDYYCEKDGDRWLIDVTINQRKNLVKKALQGVAGFKEAVLLKKENDWKLLEIVKKEIGRAGGKQ